MPTLQITLNKNIEDVSLIHDIGSQEMKLRQVIVEYGIEASAPDIQTGLLVDLSRLGASTSEIVGYTPNVSETSHLYIPRPGKKSITYPSGGGSSTLLSQAQFGYTTSTEYHVASNGQITFIPNVAITDSVFQATGTDLFISNNQAQNGVATVGTINETHFSKTSIGYAAGDFFILLNQTATTCAGYLSATTGVGAPVQNHLAVGDVFEIATGVNSGITFTITALDAPNDAWLATTSASVTSDTTNTGNMFISRPSGTTNFITTVPQFPTRLISDDAFFRARTTGGGAGTTIDVADNFFIMRPNLSFHTGDVIRDFKIKTFKDKSPIELADFSATGVRQITLYFDYETNDVNR